MTPGAFEVGLADTRPVSLDPLRTLSHTVDNKYEYLHAEHKHKEENYANHCIDYFLSQTGSVVTGYVG